MGVPDPPSLPAFTSLETLPEACQEPGEASTHTALEAGAEAMVALAAEAGGAGPTGTRIIPQKSFGERSLFELFLC